MCNIFFISSFIDEYKIFSKIAFFGLIYHVHVVVKGVQGYKLF